MVLMSVELILNAVALNFVAFALNNAGGPHAIEGHVMALFIIAIAAAEVGVALAMVCSSTATAAPSRSMSSSEMKG